MTTQTPAEALATWPDEAGRLRPAFVVVGAHKCGTTSLFKYLYLHPDVVKPATKEIHFFDRHYDRGPEWYAAMFPRRFPAEPLRRAIGRATVTGEATPSYLFHPATPRRLAAMLPDVRLVAILRNPVDRAYSHWRVAERKGWDDAPTFEEAIEREPERMAEHERRFAADPNYRDVAWFRHAYMARGRYAEQLERWFDVFPRERMLIHQSERMFADPESVWRETTAFLGLRDARPPRFDVHNLGTKRSSLDDRTRRRLIDAFRPENARLEALLGRSLDWNH